MSSTVGVAGGASEGDTVATVSAAGFTKTPPASRGVLRNPRLVLALLTALNLLNYVDRYVLSAVLAKIQEDLHLSNWVGGWLATVFLIGYFVTSPIFGALADRAATGGRKRLLALGVAIWSAATLASGVARSAFSLLAARAVVGVGEASYATIAPTLIDDLASPAQNARWMAIFNASLPVGSALGYIVGGRVEHAHGWHAAFFVAGGPGLAAAFLCLLIAEPIRSSTRTKRPLSSEALVAARTLVGLPLYRAAVLGYCAYTFAIGGFAYWAPTYVYRHYGLDLGAASVRFGTVTVVTGFVGTLAGGWLADWFARRRPSKASEASGTNEASEANETGGASVRAGLWVCAISAGLGAPLSAAVLMADTSARFFGLLVPCEIALFMSSGPINVVMLRAAPAKLRASAMALGIFSIHLLGDMISQPLIGLAADHVPFAWAMSAIPFFFAIAAIVWWRAPAGLT